MLILQNIPAWHWAFGGAAIALITLLLLLITHKRLGISTGFESVCALASRLPYFSRADLGPAGRWRLTFLLGLLCGGIVSSATGPEGWTTTWALGMFDSAIGWGPLGKCLWMFVGGCFIGFGTRLAGGCTSGHGIFGLANLEKSGMVTTLCFMGAGLITTQLIYRLLVGA